MVKQKYIGRWIGLVGFVISIVGCALFWKQIYFPLAIGLTILAIGIVYSSFEELNTNGGEFFSSQP